MSDGYMQSQDAGSLRGCYANYFEVGHNAFEFLLDFGQHYPESTSPDPARARLHTRIIVVPVYARALLELLRDAIARHEALFGVPPAPTADDERRGTP
jgi:Protein of unknown function (DUF3467)